MKKDKQMNLLESQADTYIESCFEKKCCEAEFGNFYNVLNQWRNDKSYYISYTDISAFDFQHYSMHDKSHSEEILRCIEMVLGRDRVNALNVSDLWLLLESAYCHDIGMSITYKELCEIWDKDDFKRYVEASLYNESGDRQVVARFYKKMDKLVHSKELLKRFSELKDYEESEEEFNEIFGHSYWPIIWERYILLLYTEYIRDKHPERSREKILEYGREGEWKKSDRMYGVVANVVMLHGKDFDDIFHEVCDTEKGFGSETMHPQFAAAMLRLGDLLDMDSNRYNIRAMEHMGLIPLKSMMHLKKHKSITHLSYSDSVIKAIASSEDFDVCMTANQWFVWIDEEVKNLICCWNKIVPDELKGCRLNRCELKVFYKNELFDSTKQAKFQADPERVYKMLIGENIYKSRFDFIREYIQNALDATKIQFWMAIKEQKELWDKFTPEKITPYDIERSWYDKYEIQLKINIDWTENKIVFSIQDQGIGMEKECVKALTNVAGDSWGKRSEYASQIPVMPAWLRPTGGFGIGVQSAFMITDNVEFITKSPKEIKGKRIRLDSSAKGGKVSEYEDSAAQNGTEVRLTMRLMDFIKEVQKNAGLFRLDEIKGNIYDKREICNVVQEILEKYVADIAKYSLFPVKIRCNTGIAHETGMEWSLPSDNPIIYSNNRGIHGFFENNRFNIRYISFDGRLIIWDYEKEAMVFYQMIQDFSVENRDKCYYKGILVTDEFVVTEEPFSIDVYYG